MGPVTRRQESLNASGTVEHLQANLHTHLEPSPYQSRTDKIHLESTPQIMSVQPEAWDCQAMCQKHCIQMQQKCAALIAHGPVEGPEQDQQAAPGLK